MSNLGVRLPAERIVRALEETNQVWFVVLDGAQDFCHVSTDLRHEFCDFYLAGTHKWLGAHAPMGLGFYGRRRSRGLIETALGRLLRTGDLDDPLLRFGARLDTGVFADVSETINLAPLFACHGATINAAGIDPRTRLRNGGSAVLAAEDTGWQPVMPATPFRTGILLLKAEQPGTRALDPTTLRSRFHDHGVVLTAYDEGLIRLSMPEGEWQRHDLDALRVALRASA